MNAAADIAIVVLLLLGAGFALIGSWGLVRLPTTMERLHGPTKATTLGLGALLLASVVYFRARLRTDLGQHDRQGPSAPRPDRCRERTRQHRRHAPAPG